MGGVRTRVQQHRILDSGGVCIYSATSAVWYCFKQFSTCYQSHLAATFCYPPGQTQPCVRVLHFHFRNSALRSSAVSFRYSWLASLNRYLSFTACGNPLSHLLSSCRRTRPPQFVRIRLDLGSHLWSTAFHVPSDFGFARLFFSSFNFMDSVLRFFAMH